MTRKPKKIRYWSALTAVTASLCGLSGCGTQTTTNSTPTAKSIQTTPKPTVSNPKPALQPSSKPVTVMGIGGSVARGWDDKGHGGYLVRAFNALTKEGPIKYNFVNKSIEGDGPTQMAKKYPGFLKQVSPQVVLISWGMLDDISNKTPIPDFQNAIHSEIQMALNAGCDVIVVTPPVTGASYGNDVKSEANLVNLEMAEATGFHSDHVYVIDLFNQMKAYLAAHNLDVNTYSADAWHPNTAGHVLAGQLLAQDIQKDFVQHPSTANSSGK